MTISKSKYLAYKTCPKSLWLALNKPELAIEDPSAQKHIEDGKLVGSYAKSYFKDTVDVTTYDEKGNLDISEMIGLTNRYLLESDKTIAEASISVDDLFCSIDLLHPFKDGYEIYEVKATCDVDDEHYIDVAFQKYVLEKRGLKIINVFILHLDRGYKKHGDIELNKLFIKENISMDPKFLNAMMVIEDDLRNIKNILNEKNELNTHFLSACKDCPFKGYCTKDLPKPSVFDLHRFNKKYDYLNSGVIAYKDILTSDAKLNRWQSQQIEAYLGTNKTIVHVEELQEYLTQITYPIYHLDFESVEYPIPPCDDAWPYEQIPTQYSLHIEHNDGRLEHKEFLGDSVDPRRAIAEALCRDIPMDVCVTAYHKSFECGRLNELADLFPDLADHLRNISDHVVDLEVPFAKGMYYHADMGGRSSIKAVLPALYPDDPELDYHALPVVHNGGEAMDIYPKMLEAEPNEKARIRDGLLKYCCLDTLAMVKVLQKIKEITK